MAIAYFAHELADAAVQKRVRMLALAGREVTLLGFERDRGDPSAASAHQGIALGHTQNQRLIARVFSVLLAIPRALRVKQSWRDAELIIARNLEMLVLVSVLKTLTGSRARIAYECLDIHRVALSNGIAGRIVRAVERACLGGGATIVTSSPAFERYYFRGKQHLSSRIMLAENKVLTPANAAAPELGIEPPWIVAWCGVLRCKRSFDLLRKLATERGVRVELWGMPALDQIPDFHEAVAATPNLTFHGAYKADHLPHIYARAHFSWAIDFYEAGGNSDWLLPNRLYESLCYGAVPLAAEGVETARWLEAHGVGAVLGAPIERATDTFFAALTPDGYRRLRDATLQLPPEATRFTPESCRAFAAELAGAAA
jgi:succinoglycan biosynthesis protein ExoL